MRPSKHQFAVAAAAVLRADAHGQQMWKQPAGTGKTRTLIAMIYLFFKIRGTKKFTVYFANQEQIDSDRRIFEEL